MFMVYVVYTLCVVGVYFGAPQRHRRARGAAGNGGVTTMRLRRNATSVHLGAVILAIAALSSASAQEQFRYRVDVQSEDVDYATRRYLVAYDDLTYTIDGQNPVNLNGPFAVGHDSIGLVHRMVNLTWGWQFPAIMLRLSSPAGYVFTTSNERLYSSNNSSNDHMILARGRNAYVDTEFLLYNPAPTVSTPPGNPGKLVITAMDADANVTVTDLQMEETETDSWQAVQDGIDDTEADILIRAGMVHVKALSHRVPYRVTSDKPVSVYFGTIRDGNAEIMPTRNQNLVGAQAFVATPNYLGVVAMGDGEIRVFLREEFAGDIVEQELFRGQVTKGQGIFLPVVRSVPGGTYTGVTPVRIAGTTAFYTYVGMGNRFATYLGGTAIPFDPDPAYAPGTRFYVQSLVARAESYLDVIAYEDNAVVTVRKVGDPATTLAPDSTVGYKSTYTIPANAFMNGASEGLVETTWEVIADKPLSLYLRHSHQLEHGGIVISPDFIPPTLPDIGAYDVVSVHHVPAIGDRTTYLRVDAVVLDVENNLSSVELKGPDGLPIAIPEEFITRTPSGLGPYSRIEIHTGNAGLPYPFRPGSYTLTATDEGGLQRTGVDVVSDVPLSILGPALNNIPAPGSREVEPAPTYAWFPPRAPYASNYAIEVSSDSTFADPGAFVLTEDQTWTQDISIVHGQRTGNLLNINTSYYWRVQANVLTLEYGYDIRVIGPTWKFTTRGTLDETPPEFVSDPAVIARDLAKVTLSWQTNERSRGTVAWGSPGFAEPTGTAADEGLAERHIFTFTAGAPGTTYELFVQAADAAGNTRNSPRVSFRTSAVSDATPPRITAGPAPTSISETKARITWFTDEPAGGQISWFIDGVNPILEPDRVMEKKELDRFTLRKEMEITDLLPDTTYFYQVKVIDQAGNLDMSPILRFRTRGVGDVTPPRIVGAVIPVEVGVDRAVLVWRTDEGAYSKILYGTSRNLLDQSQGNVADVLVLEHRVELLGLTPSTKYWYTAVSLDAALNEGRSDTLSLTTRAGNDITSPAILPPAPGRINKGLVLRAAPRQGIPETRAHWSSSEENSGRVEVTTDSTRGPDSLFADRSIVRTYAAPDYAREHEVDLTDLELGTRHWAMIIVRDRAGNVSRGVPIEFTTPTELELDTTPPSITSAMYIDDPMNRRWRFELMLSEPADVRIMYGTDPNVLDLLFVSLDKKRHHIILASSAPDTNVTYFYKRRVTDVAGNFYEDPLALTFRLSTIRIPPPLPNQPFADGPSVRFSGQSSGGQAYVIVSFATTVPVSYEAFLREVGVTGDAERVVNTEFKTRHTVQFTALKPGVQYEYVLILTDQNGNRYIWPEGSEVAKTATGWQILKIGRTAEGRFSSAFTTAVVADLTPPVIVNGPRVLARTTNSVTIGWRTDELADGRVRFEKVGVAGKPARVAAVELTNEIAQTDLVFEHALSISGLDTNSAYLFEVGSNDPMGNGETVSGQQGFSTTAEADVAPPAITEEPVVQTLTDTRATIKWVTDETSDSQVDVLEHGRPVEERVTAYLPDLVTEHVITATGLKPSKLYDFMVSSQDASGNGPTLRLSTFTTPPGPDLIPPILTELPQVVRKDDVSAKIVWKTDEISDSYVEYGTTTSYGLVAQDVQRNTVHELTLTGLQLGTKYYFRVQSADMAGNEFLQAAPDSFITDTQPDDTPPATPQGLKVTAGDGAMYLSWSPNTEPDLGSYLVERSTDDATYAPVAMGLQTSSYLDSPLDNGVTCFYRVAAVDNSRNRNQSPYTATGAETQGTPAVGKSPQAPVIADYRLWPYGDFLGYPLFYYYDPDSGIGEPYRPVLRIGNVPDVVRPGAKMSYGFAVALDPDFKTVVATGTAAPGDTIIGGSDSWFWALINVRAEDPAYFDTTLMTHVPDSTSWIPSRDLPSGVQYYWRVRAHDGIFYGPWSEARSFSSMLKLELYPGRADCAGVVLRPEEEATEIWGKHVSVTLEAFAAEGDPTSILVTWAIRHDGEALGAHLLRSTSSELRSFERLSDGLLPLDGRFTDRTARPGVTYYYRLEVPTTEGQSRFMGMTSGRLAAPVRFALGKNRPNPFNPVTVVPYTLPERSKITLSVYDVTGRLVRTLVDGDVQEAGFHQVGWDGTDATARPVGSGLYICRLERVPSEGGVRQTLLERMVLVR